MTHPKPETMSVDDLTAIVDDIRGRIPAGDSFEGNLTWAMPEDPDADPRSFDVVACYRVGNTTGQGGMRMIGNWDGPVVDEHGPCNEMIRDRDQQIADLRANLQRCEAALAGPRRIPGFPFDAS